MKNFADFMDSFSQDDIDKAVTEFSENVKQDATTIYSDLSDDDRHMNRAINGLLIRLLHLHTRFPKGLSCRVLFLYPVVVSVFAWQCASVSVK